jgi:alpha-galactosidase
VEVDFRSFRIDFLKYDNCHNEGLSPKFRYPTMRDALNKTGRPIYFSMCEWGREKPYQWAKPIANSWRTTIDIKDIYLSFIHNLEHQVGLSSYAGPGSWNDPDML